MQITVLIISLLLMTVLTLVFVLVIRSAGTSQVSSFNETNRRYLIRGMLYAGVVITLVSLRPWPHAISSTKDVIQINATGYQWYWELDKEEVPVGRRIIFNVHTKDVTHGLGVSDPDGKLLFQTQAMPGYVNQVEYVFSKPGTYKILCMEFCGVAHHDMMSEIKVVKK